MLVIPGAPPLNMSQCEWSVEPSDTTVRALYLSATTTSGLEDGGAGGGGYSAGQLFDDTRAGFTGAVDVPGLGDGAFFTTAEQTDLQVLYGETLLNLSSLTLGADTPPVSPRDLRILIEIAGSNL